MPAPIVLGTPVRLDAEGQTYEAEKGRNRIVMISNHMFNNDTFEPPPWLFWGAHRMQWFHNERATSTSSASWYYCLEKDIKPGAHAITLTWPRNVGSLSYGGFSCHTIGGIEQTSPNLGTNVHSWLNMSRNAESNQHLHISTQNAAYTANTYFNGGVNDTFSFANEPSWENGLIIGSICVYSLFFDSWTPPSGWTEHTDATEDIGPTGTASKVTDGTNQSGSWVQSASRNGDRVHTYVSLRPARGSIPKRWDRRGSRN